MLESVMSGDGQYGAVPYRRWLQLVLWLGLSVQWSVAGAQNPNPHFQGNSPPGGWQHSINGSTESVLVAEGDIFTLAIDEHAYDFCSESSTDNCITGIRWFWFDRTYYAPFNNGVAWSVELEIVDPDNDCRGSEDYTCTVRVVSVTQNGDFCGYPKLGFITPIIVDYVGDYSPGIPNTSGLPYILSEPLYLDLGPADCPPVALLDPEAPDPSQGEDSLTWSFDGSRSNDPDNLDPSTFWIPVGDSEGIVTWIWDFGDGAGGSGPQPSHQYQEPGFYEVTLTVFDDEGDEAEITESIDVTGEIDAAFTYAAEPGDPLTINFDGSGSSSPYAEIIDWYWYFGDGTDSAQSAVMTQHTYNEPGTYDVELAVIDDLGNEGEITMSIVVGSSEPVALPTFQKDANNLLVVHFDGSGSFDPDDGDQPGAGIDRVQWDLGDSATFSDQMTFSHTYDAINPYRVTLAVFDNEGEVGTKEVLVDLTYDITASAAVFATQTANERIFDGSASQTHPNAQITEWAWSFGDGASGTGEFVSHVYAEPGDYTITLEVTDQYGEFDVEVFGISVDGLDPIALARGGLVAPDSMDAVFDGAASYDPDDGSAPGDGIVSWQWDFGDGSASSGAAVAHSYGEAGAYTVTLTVTDDEGATATDSLTVTVAAGDGSFSLTFPGRFGGQETSFSVTRNSDGSLKISLQSIAEAGGLGAFCSNILERCFHRIEDGGRRAVVEVLPEVSQLTCAADPSAPWCGTRPEIGNMFDKLSEAFRLARQQMELFRDRTSPPPGGGLPTYAASRQEASELRAAVKSLQRATLQANYANGMLDVLGERMRAMLVAPGPEDPAPATLLLGGAGGSVTEAQLITVPGGSIGGAATRLVGGSHLLEALGIPINSMFANSACEQALGDPSLSGCFLAPGLDYQALAEAMGTPFSTNQTGLARQLLRPQINGLGRKIGAIGRQINRGLFNALPGEVVEANPNLAQRITATQEEAAQFVVGIDTDRLILAATRSALVRGFRFGP